ncbi:MAG: DUF3037 domain-containing protein [Thermomicrobiales bacterium]
MPERSPFEYVVIRVMPRVDRGEFVNAGVMLICRPHRFLGARMQLDRRRVKALDPTLSDPELAAIEEQLAQLCAIAHGEPAAGSLAGLSPGERWHLLSAPTSTVVQPSPVHTGLCVDPAAELDSLFAELVPVLPRSGDPANQPARDKPETDIARDPITS